MFNKYCGYWELILGTNINVVIYLLILKIEKRMEWYNEIKVYVVTVHKSKDVQEHSNKSMTVCVRNTVAFYVIDGIDPAMVPYSI